MTMDSLPIRFVDVYKWIYLLAILIGLILMSYDRSADWRMNQYLVNGLVFLVNLASWFMFRKSNPVGFTIERVLSLGRMAMCGAIASLLLSPLVLWSPIAEVLWFPLMDVSKQSQKHQGFVSLWMVCLAIFGLEILYFKSIGKIHHDDEQFGKSTSG